MTEPVTIVVMGAPVGKGRPRFTRAGHTYTPDKTRSYEQSVAWAAKAEMGSRQPIDGPLRSVLNSLAVGIPARAANHSGVPCSQSMISITSFPFWLRAA